MAQYRIVETLPDLISPEEYQDHPHGDVVRVRICVEDGVIRILGDAMRPELLEQLLERLGPETIEQMLCG
jgi:hypothetical protein